MTNKTYRVIISVEAEDMIKGHIEFLANVSVSAARMLHYDLLAKLKRIEEAPFMYPVYMKVSQVEYRKLVFKRYLILYTINEERSTVEIEYVWDTRMNNEISK